MRFIEKIFNREVDPIKNLHPDFKIADDSWRHNRSIRPGEKVDMKIRFGFDDPNLLNSCPFMAKIGMNADPAVKTRYIGFAYGNSKDELAAYGQRFDFLELIEGLDANGVSVPESKITVLKEN